MPSNPSGSARSKDMADLCDFLVWADRLKSVERLNLIRNGQRRENAAEHSWHITLQAILLAQYAPSELNLGRSIRLLVIHDLVEIQAGDHWVSDQNASKVKMLESKAAQTIFSDLPLIQQREFQKDWVEFSEQKTLEAKYAHAIDALHPMILLWHGDGHGKTHKKLKFSELIARKKPAIEVFPELWAYAESMLLEALSTGQLEP